MARFADEGHEAFDEAYAGEDDDDEEEGDAMRADTPSVAVVRQQHMDGGLARLCPDCTKISLDGYRGWRRRVQIFERGCRNRGGSALGEGALLILQQLVGVNWEACEAMDLDVVESDVGIAEILKCLDVLYRFEPEIEMPDRCEEFFNEFIRQKHETLTAYCVRHQQALARLKEAGVEIPITLAGWHLLTRSAVPAQHVPTIKSRCHNKLETRNVVEALKEMFGGNSVPVTKDIERVASRYNLGKKKDDTFYLEDDFVEEDDDYYDDDEYD